MPTVRYFSMNGEIVGEQTAGQSRLNYVPDALGSVIGVTNTSNAVTFSARYNPYGSVLTSSGTTPNFTWIGTLGYNSAVGRSHCESYVRKRIGSTTDGRWSSIDPLWPS